MSSDGNRAMLRRLFEDGINKDDPRVFDELIGPNYVNHDMPAPGPGPEGVKQVIATFETVPGHAHLT